jgi:CBS domain-containing protein
MAASTDVTVVIGSNGAVDAVGRCLAALEPQRDGAEVIVCEPVTSPPEVRERFGWASFVECPGALVPKLWSEGIERAGSPYVALTIAPMIPAPDWLATVRAQLGRHPVVAGAIDPADGLRLADWAEYLCRYAKDMRPFEAHACLDLPGDNTAYRRDLLVHARDLYKDGFWEPVVNRRLAEDGAATLTRPVRAIMTTDVTTCDLRTTVDEIMQTMTERRIRHLPVIEDGQLSGIISIGDVVKCRIDELQTETETLHDYLTTGRG